MNEYALVIRSYHRPRYFYDISLHGQAKTISYDEIHSLREKVLKWLEINGYRRKFIFKDRYRYDEYMKPKDIFIMLLPIAAEMAKNNAEAAYD